MSAGDADKETAKGPRYDWKRRAIQEYATFRPDAKQVNKSYASLCLYVMNGVADGSFRIAYNSNVTKKIKLPLSKIFNTPSLSEFDAELVIRPDELIFQENSMFTRWCSIKKLCLAKSIYLHHDVFTMEAAFDALNKTLEPLIDVCFRFALTVNKRGNTGFELMCLALPASENHLNDDQRLSGSSVSGMVLDSTYLISPILTDEEDCSDLKQVLPCAPILFTNSALSLDDYKKIVRDTFTAIMIKFKIFQDLSYEEAVQAVQSNKVSGVVQRYKPLSSLTKNQSAPGFQDNPTLSDEELQGTLYNARSDIDNENVHSTKFNKTSSHDSLADARARRNDKENLSTMRSDNSQGYFKESTNVNSTNDDSSANMLSKFVSALSNKDNSNNTQFSNIDLAKIISMLHSDNGDKSAGQANLSDDDLQYRFPTLFNEGYFKENPSYQYLKLSWLAQEELAAKNRLYNQPNTIKDKLDSNSRKVLVMKKWDSDYDDLNLNLHPIRFERSPVTSATALFTMAANRISYKQIPINAYDFTAFKHIHQISHEAYIEAHDLSSQKFSLKMFTEANFNKFSSGFQSFKIVENKNSNGADIQSGSMFNEVKSMTEFHRAFFWASKLRRKVLPIDESFDALFYFLIESDFFYAPSNGDGYGRGSVNQGTFCANFCDYIIRINNDRFSKKLPFITTEEMLSVYINFCRNDSRFRQPPPFHRQRSAQQPPLPQQQQQPQPGPSTSNRIRTCRYFNLQGKSCLRKPANDGSACTDKGGYTWNHVCSKVSANGSVCGQAHPEYDHQA